MKVKLLIDCTGPNPDFDPSRDRHSARNRAIPAGTIVDHPDAWMLCCPERIELFRNGRPLNKFRDGQIRAEPADDEAREALRRFHPKVAEHFGLYQDSVSVVDESAKKS